MKVPRGLYVSFLITSEKFTLNDQGSLEGWASTPEEALRRLPLTTSIKNLYLTGHWAMPGGDKPGDPIWFDGGGFTNKR